MASVKHYTPRPPSSAYLPPSLQRQEIARKQAQGLLLRRVSSIITYSILGLMALVVLAPFTWLFLSSLKDTNQFFAVPMVWFPQPAHWVNYAIALNDYHFGQKVFNSIWLAVVSALAESASSALVAYGFARFHFPGRTALFLVVLATMMIPTQLLSIALFTVYRNLGWIDTFLPLLVPKFFGSAFIIFIYRQFFLKLPREIDEAGRLDGLNALGIFWHMILPQSKPIIIVASIFSFLNSWRDAWGPLIYLSSDEKRTIPVGLLFFTTPYGPNYPLIMAATVIALAVPVVLYVLGQRYIDRGVAIADVR